MPWHPMSTGVRRGVDALLVGLFLAALAAAHLPLCTAAASNYWPVVRAVGSMNLLHGFKWYSALPDVALVNQLYPPISLYAYAPLALLQHPMHLWIGSSLLLFAYYALPLALVLFRGTTDRRLGAVALLFFLAVSYCVPPLRYIACSLHVDAPAVGLTVLAIYCAMHGQTQLRRVLLSCVFATAAVWTKQTFIPVLLVFPTWVLCTEGWAACRRYALTLAALNLICLAGFGLAYGFSDLLFCLVRYPLSHPLVSPEEAASRLCAPVGLALFMLAPGIAAIGRLTAGRDLAAVRASLAPHGSLLAGALGYALLAPGLRALVKDGGDVNDWAPFLYFLVLAIVLAILKVARQPRVSKAHVLAFALAAIGLDARVYSTQRSFWPDNPAVVEAFDFARAHPGETYFPEYPMVHLLVDRRLVHFKIGLYEYENAGHTISHEQIQQFVPPDFKYICVEQWYELSAGLERFLGQRFERGSVAGLAPRWQCARRIDAQP